MKRDNDGDIHRHRHFTHSLAQEPLRDSTRTIIIFKQEQTFHPSSVHNAFSVLNWANVRSTGKFFAVEYFENLEH